MFCFSMFSLAPGGTQLPIPKQILFRALKSGTYLDIELYATKFVFNQKCSISRGHRDKLP